MNRKITLFMVLLMVIPTFILCAPIDSSGETGSIDVYKGDTVYTGPLLDDVRLEPSTVTTSEGIQFILPFGTILTNGKYYITSTIEGQYSLDISMSLSSSIGSSFLSQCGITVSLLSSEGSIIGSTSLISPEYKGTIDHLQGHQPYYIRMTTASSYQGTQVPEASGITFTFTSDYNQNHIVTFDPNGGTVSPTSKMVIEGNTYGELPTPTKTGHIFDGWYTQSSGGEKITSSTKVTQTSDHTLYAHWTKVITVSFDTDGGSPQPPSKDVNVGRVYGALPVITKDNHSFDGWFTDDGTRITSDSIVSLQDDHTLHARWTPGKLTVSFDVNGSSSVTPQPMEFIYGTQFHDLPIVERYGYTFSGWYTSAEGGEKVSDGDTVNTTGSITLYAHWTPKDITVSFDTEGGSPTQSIRVTFSDTYGNLPTTTKRGYTFSGWYTSDGKEITESTRVTIGEDHTLHAHWTPDQFTVSFDTQGGSPVSPSSITVTFGQPYGQLPSTAKDGNIFSGWYTSDGTLVTESTTVSLTEDHTLHARWIPITITVTFDPNGGSVEEMTKEVTVGGKYGKLPTASRMGHTFSGWYTEPDGGSRVVPGTDVTQTTDHTLYAHWSKDTPVTPPTPKPDDPKPKPPEEHKSEIIGDDGSKTETTTTVTTDGKTTTTVQKEVNTGLDGSTIVKETTSVSEKTSTGSVTEVSSEQVIRDSKGNIISTSETTGTITVDGDRTISSLETVNRDGKGTITSQDTVEGSQTTINGRTEYTETTVSVGPDGTTITEISGTSRERDGSLETTEDRKVTYKDADGNTLRVESYGSEVRETTLSDGVTKVTVSVNTFLDKDDNITSIQEVRSEITNRTDGDTSIVTSSVITVSKDPEGNITSTLKEDNETVRSPGSDIVTSFRTEEDSSLGNRVEEGIRSTDPSYSVTTVASKVMYDDNVVVGVRTTLNYLDDLRLDSQDVDIAYQHSIRTTYGTEFESSDRFVRVEARNTVTIATQSAFMSMSERGMGLYVEGPDGSITYDVESCRGFSMVGGDVKVSMAIGGELTDGQRMVIGDHHFITVSAMAGDVYITDIDGKVTMTFAFDIGDGRYRACHVSDDGSIEEMPWSYDRHTGKVSIESGHHSVYAMLPVEEPEENDGGFPWVYAIIISIIVAAAVAAIIWRNRA